MDQESALNYIESRCDGELEIKEGEEIIIEHREFNFQLMQYVTVKTEILK